MKQKIPGSNQIIMRKIPCLFTIIISLFFSASAYGQMPDYHVQVLDQNAGIRNFFIRGITKDSNGFLWILYHDRVQRFDGREIKDFPVDGQAVSILCDRASQIWITTKDQVLRFENDHSGFRAVQIADSGRPVIGRIFQVSGGKVCLLSQNGFYSYDSLHNNFKALDLGISGLKLNTPNFAYCNHTIFFSGKELIYSLNLDTKKMLSLPAKSVFSMEAVSEHKLLVSNWDYNTSAYDFLTSKISHFDVGSFSSAHPDSFFRINQAVSLDSNNYLVSSQKGLLEFNTATGVFKPLHLFYGGHQLYVETTYVMYKDAQQTIWVGYDGGILFFSPLQGNIELIRSAALINGERIWNNNVRNFAEDEKGNIWFVTGDGFNYWNITSGEIKTFPEQNAPDVKTIYPSIRGVAYDGKNLLLGPTNFGLKIYDPVSGIYRKPNYDKDAAGMRTKVKAEQDFINQITPLKNGDFVISSRDAAYNLKDKTYQLTEIPFPADEKSRVFSYEDAERRIWIGGVNKLRCFDSSFRQLYEIPVPPGPGENYFRCMYESKPNEFLVGGKGLYHFNTQQKQPVAEKENTFFDNAIINFLFKDMFGRFWIGSDNGLSLYTRPTKNIQTFDYSDNLQGVGFNNQAVYLSHKGTLYIGGTNGINYFKPELIREKNERLHVTVLNMSVNADDSSFLTNSLPAKLSYLQNSLRFEFVAPWYYNAKRIQYRYRLEGLNSNWVQSGNNSSISFTALAPGHYTFLVSASLNGRDWFESQPVSFSISPPFWNDWWFYLLCIVAAGSILYALYRFRISQVIKLQTVRNRISSELHDDIGSKLTNINILATLTRQHMQQQPDRANVHLQRISDEVQTSSDALNDIVWSLNSRNDSAEEIIARMRRYAAEVLSGEQLQLNINIPEDIQRVKFPIEKRHDLYLLFKEIINNIHKHAQATAVVVEVLMQRAALVLHIKDNGIGFDKNQGRPGNGLINLKERALKWGGSFELVSSPGNGTEITIQLPLRTTHPKRL
ncbi:MAG: triple tyrosine motif-containing protein [Chitinophagaceae bacterium]